MTNTALWAGISACGPGRPFNSIGQAIHELVRNTPYSVCNALSGHGIGRVFHQPPWIYHTRMTLVLLVSISNSLTVNEEPGMMRPGHCFTIEVWIFGQRYCLVKVSQPQPCIVQGSNPQVWIFPDGWTVSTEASNRCSLYMNFLGP